MPEMHDGPLSAMYKVHTIEVPDLRLTLRGGTPKGGETMRRWLIFHSHCALQGKTLLVAALYINNKVRQIYLLRSRVEEYVLKTKMKSERGYQMSESPEFKLSDN